MEEQLSMIELLIGKYSDSMEYRELADSASRVLKRTNNILAAQYIALHIHNKNEKDKQLVDIATPHFLKEAMQNIDAITILISAGQIEQCELQLRNLLELFATVKFIYSSKDANSRVAYYLYKNILSKTEIAELLDPEGNTQDHKAIERIKTLKNKEVQEEAIRYIENQHGILMGFKEYKEAVEKVKTIKDIRKCKWYALYDKEIYSFRKLLKAIGCEYLYPTIYGMFSSKTHGNSLIATTETSKIDDDNLFSIRDCGKMPGLLRLAVYLVILLLRQILPHYSNVMISNEKFNKQYKEIEAEIERINDINPGRIESISIKVSAV